MCGIFRWLRLGFVEARACDCRRSPGEVRHFAVILFVEGDGVGKGVRTATEACVPARLLVEAVLNLYSRTDGIELADVSCRGRIGRIDDDGALALHFGMQIP